MLASANTRELSLDQSPTWGETGLDRVIQPTHLGYFKGGGGGLLVLKPSVFVLIHMCNWYTVWPPSFSFIDYAGADPGSRGGGRGRGYETVAFHIIEGSCSVMFFLPPQKIGAALTCYNYDEPISPMSLFDRHPPPPTLSMTWAVSYQLQNILVI